MDAISTDDVDLILVTCVKTKRSTPAAAKDLYISDLFKKQRRYAEGRALPWFILSAEHGLVQPEDWLSPYERYLPDMSSAYRTAWASWVAARLDVVAGALEGAVVEVHASSTYVTALRPHLESLGAKVITPLAGLGQGQRLAWYLGRASAGDAESGGAEFVQDDFNDEVARFVTDLRAHESAITPPDFVAGNVSIDIDQAGLYSWWVDEPGANELARGLEFPLTAGMIYAGLAGATKWPSGKRSTNTLRKRVRDMHLGGRHEFSTFRRTLGAILANAREETEIDETALTEWMYAHLKVVALAHDDPDTLGKLERQVLAELDPPLNLASVGKSPSRTRLSELRRNHR
ncbi:DUF6884 domain-containing protein [Nocardioides salsibiostraticola]